MSDCPLTERQLEIVRELANGLRREEIAEKLFISKGTCDKTLIAARANMRARTNAHLVSIVIAAGYLEWNIDDQMRYLSEEESEQQ